ncbi:MAG: anti-sigma regulatory factor [Anaerolineae bacterium]|jgi:serine/threonine-protein kinase RsbT
MTHQYDGQVNIESEGDIVVLRKTVRDTARALGFGVTDVTRIVTAASELTRNVYLYAGSGTMRWRQLKKNNDTTGIELIFEDHGPGIANIEQALEPGYSTGGGLGLGLPGAKRLMDEMEIHSEVGEGTLVTVKKWLRG